TLSIVPESLQNMLHYNLRNTIRRLCAIAVVILIGVGTSSINSSSVAQMTSTLRSTSSTVDSLLNRKPPVGKKPPVVPETNAGWVLLPFFLAVLLVSLRQVMHARSAQGR